VSYSQLFSYYYLFSFRVLIVMERSDSHTYHISGFCPTANMPVAGRHAFIISDTGRVADVNAFTSDYKPMQVSIVDAAIQYDCPYDGQTYILVIQNVLHVPSMKNNLLPPFVMREAGIHVYDKPKIQVAEPTAEDHSICFLRQDSESLYHCGECSHIFPHPSQLPY
jgi:hypothetical protein